MNQQAAPRSLSSALVGRTFVHPIFDYLLIGGGLSLIVTAVITARSGEAPLFDPAIVPYIVLLSTSAHFSASTVRLYTKPGAYEALPFLCYAFPLITIAAVTVCMIFATELGPHVQALYLTWSPYHYAAQVYGLSVMYSYRSGCLLGSFDKKLLWWTCMLPFFFVFLTQDNSGLDWVIGKRTVDEQAHWLFVFFQYFVEVLRYITFLAPVLLCLKIWRSKSGPMPLIALVTIIANGIWWFVLGLTDAFIWATVFHGIQYMAIVAIFHQKDQVARPGNRRSPAYHVTMFYVMCVALAYLLFRIFPEAYMLLGFGRVEATLLVVAAINIHHFTVDGYIWRLKKTDGNRKIVDSVAGPISAESLSPAG